MGRGFNASTAVGEFHPLATELSVVSLAKSQWFQVAIALLLALVQILYRGFEVLSFLRWIGNAVSWICDRCWCGSPTRRRS